MLRTCSRCRSPLNVCLLRIASSRSFGTSLPRPSRRHGPLQSATSLSSLVTRAVDVPVIGSAAAYPQDTYRWGTVSAVDLHLDDGPAVLSERHINGRGVTATRQVPVVTSVDVSS